MALTPSNPFPLQTLAPDFQLPDTVSGEVLGLNDVKGENGTMVMFICNHCPFVIHVNAQLVKLAHDYQSKGIGFVAISSNDVENYPQDAPEFMTKLAHEQGYPFPYLYDQDQAVAKAYDATCTPDFYLFDEQLKSTYHGQLDASRPKSDIPVTGADMRQALDDLLAGRPYSGVEKPSMGCNIKWK